MDKTVSNQHIIDQFKKAAAVLEVIQDNFFRVRAYHNAIATIQNMDEELVNIYERGEVDDIAGIGKELSQKIEDIITQGKSEELEELFSKVPQGMFPLLDIPGIGPKRAHQLAVEFELNDKEAATETVKKAAEEGRVSKLEGFGDKLEQQLLENLKRDKPKNERMSLDKADYIAQKLLSFLTEIPEVKQVMVMGSVRRRRETIGDVDIGVSTKEPETVAKKLEKYPDIAKVQASGSNVVRVVLVGNKQADIKFADPEEFGSTLQHFTGSKLHNIALRELAIDQGKSLSEHGIKVGDKLKPIADEKKFYRELGLEWIPPELRENTGEIQAAKNKHLPNLIKAKDIRGELHTHTNFEWHSSHDYGGPVPKLLSEAQDLGLSWIALGDHNPSNKEYSDQEMTNIVQERNRWIDDQYQTWKEAVKNRTLKILKTLEVDIRPNGTLAIPRSVTELLDFVIVSVHSNMLLSTAKQTERILKALSHPKVKIFAHPTTRIINKRGGINADWPEIFAVCKERHIALEINANPRRLDLPDTLVKQAVEAGVMLSLGTDAHEADHLHFYPYGVDVARRGWVEKDDMVNTFSYNQLKQWLKK